MTIAQESLQRKNGELLQAYREKSRKYNQTQELYDKLKRRVMLGQVQDAASDAVDNIEASAANSRFIDQPGNLERQSAKPLVFPGPQGATMAQTRLREEEILRSMMPPAGRAAFSSQDSSHCTSWFLAILQVPSITGCIGTDSTQTPSSHRQRLPSGTNAGIGFASLQNGNSISTPLPQRRVTSARQPLARLSPNANLGIGLSGYGISAGAKISHPPAAVQKNSSGYRPSIRSRGRLYFSPCYIRMLRSI
jgi:E3 ubiquitin-protein ligase CCNP1IP1